MEPTDSCGWPRPAPRTERGSVVAVRRKEVKRPTKGSALDLIYTPLDEASLPPGRHKVKSELVEANHNVFPGQVVALTLTVPDHDGVRAHSKPLR
jgi:hypothetical protein